MWDMRKGTFTNFPGDPGGDIHYWVADYKRCCGHKGHWECADDYPDHMVPVSEFNKDRNIQPLLLRGNCKKCHRYSISLDKHPITGKLKRNWKTDHAKLLGGNRGTSEWQSYLDKAEFIWKKDWKEHLLNTAPGEEVIAHIKRSEFGQSKPMTKRMSTEVEGERVPEGWVYVVRNPDLPHTLKIGKTFPDGIASIMSDARRFGRAELLHKCFECHASAHNGDANILDFQADFIFKTLTKAFSSGILSYIGEGSKRPLVRSKDEQREWRKRKMFGEDLED
jgi:hypothetical protein